MMQGRHGWKYSTVRWGIPGVSGLGIRHYGLPLALFLITHLLQLGVQKSKLSLAGPLGRDGPVHPIAMGSVLVFFSFCRHGGPAAIVFHVFASAVEEESLICALIR